MPVISVMNKTYDEKSSDKYLKIDSKTNNNLSLTNLQHNSISATNCVKRLSINYNGKSLSDNDCDIEITRL